MTDEGCKMVVNLRIRLYAPSTVETNARVDREIASTEDVAWELFVVNNGCTDHTDQVIAAFAGRLPVRREFEDERGLSRARNRVVDTSKPSPALLNLCGIWRDASLSGVGGRGDFTSTEKGTCAKALNG